MGAAEAWAKLAARGCRCGGGSPASCELHGRGDNRGIAAWFKAGMPGGFPMEDCTCSICGTGGCLMYPDVRLDDPDSDHEHRPTLVCPVCSTAAAERALRAEVETSGLYPSLKPLTVFGGTAVAA